MEMLLAITKNYNRTFNSHPIPDDGINLPTIPDFYTHFWIFFKISLSLILLFLIVVILIDTFDVDLSRNLDVIIRITGMIVAVTWLYLYDVIQVQRIYNLIDHSPTLLPGNVSML